RCAGDHGRHPLRTPGAEIRLDRRKGSGEGGTRDRLPVPPQGLDDALPPRGVARTQSLSRTSTCLRCVCAGAPVPLLRGRPHGRGHRRWTVEDAFLRLTSKKTEVPDTDRCSLYSVQSPHNGVTTPGTGPT